MASIVGGFLMPHDPLMAAQPHINEQAKAESCRAAFAEISRRLVELKTDTVIIIGDDHYTIFGPHCIPRYLIGIGDVEGPVEPWLGIPRQRMPNNEALATHIMEHGFNTGVDWSYAKSLTLDHSITIPYHFVLGQNSGIRSIPVYLNAGVLPVIASRRAHEIGRNIAEAVASWNGNERVAVFGTGGISHWVGSVEMGRVNEAFDRRILGMAERWDVEGLIALSDEYLLEEAGNGSLEIKNWLCAMGIMGAGRAELIAYEPIPEWICGCGFAELKSAA
jgi:protocatechuate 4,5-dioxygenase, beta chain